MQASSKWNEIHTKLVAPLAMLTLAVGIAFAQGDEADIIGTVTDASGAVIPIAQVTLTNVETGVTHVVPTQGGHYIFSPVPPGTYNIAVKATNFQTQIITHLLIEIGVQLTEDVVMKVGDA